MQVLPTGKKGNMVIVMVMVGVLLLILAGVSLANNGNGVVNWFYDDVQSGTDVVPGCEPKKYLVEMKGTLDLINQKQSTWSLDYEIDYIDTHINDIFISQQYLGVLSNEFEAKICLYDVLAGGDKWVNEQVDCISIKDKITKGQIEKYPFSFRYNLYDNDCNGQVDDHTFNLIAEIQTEDGFDKHEKTVAIVDGKAVFQNVKY